RRSSAMRRGPRAALHDQRHVSPVVPAHPGACGDRTVTDGGPPPHRHPRPAAARSPGFGGNSCSSTQHPPMRKESVMNQKSKNGVALVGFLLAALCASSSFADVRWKGIVGVITAPDDPTTPAAENINNPVGNVASGTFPWSVRAGSARVDLTTG